MNREQQLVGACLVDLELDREQYSDFFESVRLNEVKLLQKLSELNLTKEERFFILLDLQNDYYFVDEDQLDEYLQEVVDNEELDRYFEYWIGS